MQKNRTHHHKHLHDFSESKWHLCSRLDWWVILPSLLSDRMVEFLFWCIVFHIFHHYIVLKSSKYLLKFWRFPGKIPETLSLLSFSFTCTYLWVYCTILFMQLLQEKLFRIIRRIVGKLMQNHQQSWNSWKFRERLCNSYYRMLYLYRIISPTWIKMISILVYRYIW